MRGASIRLLAQLQAESIPVRTIIATNDRPTRIEFDEGATRAQKERAAEIFSTFDPNVPDARTQRKLTLKRLSEIGVWTEEERDNAIRLLIEEAL